MGSNTSDETALRSSDGMTGLTWSQCGCNPGWHADADLANISTQSHMMKEIRFQMKCDEVASRRSGLIL